MNWTEFDLDLPEGISVYEGNNRDIPLRAWVGKIDLNNEGSILYEIPIIKKKTIYHSYYKIIETSYYLILILLVFIKKIFYTREN